MIHYNQVKELQQEKLRRFASEASGKGGELGIRRSQAIRRNVEQGVDWLSEARRSIANYLAGAGQETGEASSV